MKKKGLEISSIIINIVLSIIIVLIYVWGSNLMRGSFFIQILTILFPIYNLIILIYVFAKRENRLYLMNIIFFMLSLIGLISYWVSYNMAGSPMEWKSGIVCLIAYPLLFFVGLYYLWRN